MNISGESLLVILAVGIAAGWLAGQIVEGTGLGRIVSPMPRGNALMAVSCDSLAGRAELETVVLSAYCCALS